MKISINKIATVTGAQDGAIYGDYLFRFSSKGGCRVYDLSKISQGDENSELPAIAKFTLDKAELIVPHSNAVVFGNEFYDDCDEFPLLYSNVYNNYAKSEEKLCGYCCVYRIKRHGDDFSSELIQIIKIGFTDSKSLWRSGGDIIDVRPYGNFVIDIERSLYYAFVMRDGEKKTRYFSFALPKGREGVFDERFEANVVTLNEEDIVEYFDAPYHLYVQGACMHNGLIYSTEGFGDKRHPALRIIDPKKREQILHHDFYESGQAHEAEFIDFYKDKCYYGDAHGNIFDIVTEDLL